MQLPFLGVECIYMHVYSLGSFVPPEMITYPPPPQSHYCGECVRPREDVWGHVEETGLGARGRWRAECGPAQGGRGSPCPSRGS